MSMKPADNDPHKRSSLSLKNAKKQGWMWKEGGAGVSKNWKRRFFILESEYLYYYDEEVAKKPKGLIHLPEYTLIELVSEKESTKKNCFRLCDPNNKDLRVLYCSTQKQVERDEWIEALKTSLAEFQNKKARYTGKVDERLERSFYVKVADVKFKENPEEKRDVYCTISCDATQLARTPTIYQTEKPVFLEEYDFDISPSAQSVSVILKSQRKDVNIGQAYIHLTELGDHQVHDAWYNLTYVPNRIEGAKISTRWNFEGDSKRFTIHFLSTQNLRGEIFATLKCGTFEYTTKATTEVKSKKGDRSPSWLDESTTFTFGVVPEHDMLLEVWQTPLASVGGDGKDGKSKDVSTASSSTHVSTTNGREFLGGATILYELVSSQEYNMKDLWWDIVETAARPDDKVVGEIKLSLQLKEAVILPDKSYEGLFKLLLENSFDMAKRLASVSQQQERQVAEALIKSLDMRLVSIPFIREITQKEISETTRAEIIFRSNTVASKSVDLYMKLTGGPYLHWCLKDIVQQIYTHSTSGKKSCELDSQRFEMEKFDEKKAQKLREKNLVTLIGYVDQIFTRIKTSFLYCPANFRKIFFHIQKCVKEQFPDNGVIEYTAPGGFIWLRFFCPSLTAPKQFGLLEDNLSPLLSRDLTLIAKVLQNLANLVLFGKKEPYMEVCNEWLQAKQPEMKAFLTTLCSLPTEPIDEIPSKRDVANWGREMARLHFHMGEAMIRLIDKYGQQEVQSATEMIEKLNEEVELATGHTMKFKTKAPKLVLVEAESPRSSYLSDAMFATSRPHKREKSKASENEKNPQPAVNNEITTEQVDDSLFMMLHLEEGAEAVAPVTSVPQHVKLELSRSSRTKSKTKRKESSNSTHSNVSSASSGDHHSNQINKTNPTGTTRRVITEGASDVKLNFTTHPSTHQAAVSGASLDIDLGDAAKTDSQAGTTNDTNSSTSVTKEDSRPASGDVTKLDVEANARPEGSTALTVARGDSSKALAAGEGNHESEGEAKTGGRKLHKKTRSVDERRVSEPREEELILPTLAQLTGTSHSGKATDPSAGPIERGSDEDSLCPTCGSTNATCRC